MTRVDAWVALAIGAPVCVAAGFAEAAAVGASAGDAVPPGPVLALAGQGLVGAGSALMGRWGDPTGRGLFGFAAGAAFTVLAAAVSMLGVLPGMPTRCLDFCGLATVFTAALGGGLGLVALLVAMSRSPGRSGASRPRSRRSNRRPQV